MGRLDDASAENVTSAAVKRSPSRYGRPSPSRVTIASQSLKPLARGHADPPLHRRRRADELGERRRRQHEQAGRRRRDDRGGPDVTEAGAPVERRQLAEEVARPEILDALAVALDLDRAADDRVEVARPVPAFDDGVAAEHAQLLRRPHDEVESGLLQVREKRDRANGILVELARLTPAADDVGALVG